MCCPIFRVGPLRPDDGSRGFLRNIDNTPSDCMAVTSQKSVTFRLRIYAFQTSGISETVFIHEIKQNAIFVCVYYTGFEHFELDLYGFIYTSLEIILCSPEHEVE
jgi:hypothetical protein